MVRAYLEAFKQLADPRIGKVIWMSLAGAIAVYVVLFIGVGWLLDTTVISSIGWVETGADVLGGLAAAIVAYLLFPATAAALAGLFLDEVADAVEARHYPGLAPARRQPVGEMALGALKFAALALILNVLALPLYFAPVINLGVFYVLNGYLISREYFDLAAMRRMSATEAKALGKAFRGRLLLTGMVTAFFLTTPVLNIIAPVVGVAAMVHVAHRLASDHLRGERI